LTHLGYCVAERLWCLPGAASSIALLYGLVPAESLFDCIFMQGIIISIKHSACKRRLLVVIAAAAARGTACGSTSGLFPLH
jgi:hypothetical protein